MFWVIISLGTIYIVMLLSSRFSCGKFGADNALALVEAAKSGDNAEKALENLVERSSGFAINEAKNTRKKFVENKRYFYCVPIARFALWVKRPNLPFIGR